VSNNSVAFSTDVITDNPARGADDDPSSTVRGARALHETLTHSFSEAPSSSPPQAPIAPKSGAAVLRTVRRTAKVAVALAIAGGFGYEPLRSLFTPASVEAVINARIETVRSPIDGWIESAPAASAQWAGDAPRLKVSDPLADRSRLDDLRRQRALADVEAEYVARQAKRALEASVALAEQVDRFRDERMKQLDARLGEDAATLDAAVAKASLAASSRRRSTALHNSGVVAAAETEKSDGAFAIAEAERRAVEKRFEQDRVERTALESGVYVGDSYNDTPSSAQRADELRLRVADLEASAAAASARAALLAAAVSEEEALFRERSAFEAVLPGKGRVWEMLAAPGEHVSKGQDLLRVLDCSHPVVSADVDEGVYNRLTVGSPALFRPAGSSKDYLGRVVNLTGPAGASANFAIAPTALHKSPFYVTVAVGSLGESGCAVGRTGVVKFGAAADDAVAASALRGPNDAAEPR
jgi:multidrug resistance efflux pump